MDKRTLQYNIMLNSRKWWNVNNLTEVVRLECERLGLTSINHATVERNIRHYRAPRFGVIVHKRKVSANTYEFKITKGFL
jgi:hypothetical protein